MHFVPADSVRLLVNGAAAYPEMLGAIAGARSRIDMETYILRDDRAGRMFQEALCLAAARGVRVRLLYDWLGSLSLPRQFVEPLVEAGVEVAAYHPLILRRPVWALNKRDHRKMLIVDERASFTGGLNIGDEYAPASQGGQGWRDTHLRLDGTEVARAMTDLFGYAWRRATPYPASLNRRGRAGWALRRGLAGRSRAAAPRGQDAPAAGIPVSILGNEVLRYRRRIHHAYLRSIRAARHYILIENAYFIPNRAVRQALIQAARRGVFVGVVVSAHSDVPITAYATRATFDELLAGGVHLFEWPISVMHAKTAVIDDAWSIVGSYNFDHRSLLHQLECVAVVADEALAAGLRDQTLEDLSHCREITREAHRARPWWRQALERLAYLLRHWL
ncbi:MAG TPA: phosphatidylserine/phosphatidylglycerophosphate/cardiolipin synthase family protein [Phycisphaerae bacterium]|nr:phosphatidylserine/phosphatidylglycerophosphate/cardiolipin synthase family protein [Phycisphaerae bacterium]